MREPRGRAALSLHKTREFATAFAPKRSQVHGLDRPDMRRLYDARYLAVRGNAVWTPAQKTTKPISGCRSLSSRHCAKLSGGLFVRTTSPKPNGHGTPSISSRERSKKAAGLRGLERSASESRMIPGRNVSALAARTFAPTHRTSATIAGAGGNGHCGRAPAPPKETQWSAL